MSTIRALLASSSVAICGISMLVAASCADEGVTHISPRTTPDDHKDAGKPRRDARAAAPDEDDDTTAEPATGDDDSDDDVADDDIGDDDAADDDGDDDVADDDVGDDDVAPPVTKPDAGSKVDGGRQPTADAGKTDVLPPCPSGYMCMDPAGPLAAMGLMGTVTDQDGKPVAYACSTGGQQMCDPKDPKKSCPKLSDPFCAHVKITGLLAVELDNCAQKCSP